MGLKVPVFSADNTANTQHRMQPAMPLGEIDSEADFVLFSGDQGILSEHCTESEARMAYYKEAARRALGQKLPVIYERQEPHWIPLN